MKDFICIHGHFYQPPRENPWLEEIEFQASAKPFHDWNERITAECYGPNSLARILNGKGHIVDIVNNYAQMSFNFGPTLLAWMEKNAPKVYQAVLDADRASQSRFSGHGSALAQAYNHMILPLAAQREKCTQVLWGLRDFEHRFGRKPEGMWIPETAVDVETLDVLSSFGIRFTILAPYQAKRYRKLTETRWKEVGSDGIDPTTSYQVQLPSGRSIVVFFYNGPTSRAIAFERLLDNGDLLVRRLMNSFSTSRQAPQLTHVATDGETFGHHHRYGEMALAYALRLMEETEMAEVTNYGRFLESHPPLYEAEIRENTSWSCSHGIERWRSDCGCSGGGHPSWHQKWRAPLRDSLDWLRDQADSLFEREGSALLGSPWEARDDYIDVILDRSPESLQRFIDKHAREAPDEAARNRILKLLEMQRHAMLMYTSCGWFFDDLSGIETVQVLLYAARVIELAETFPQQSLSEPFLGRLEKAESNVPEMKNGRQIYKEAVCRARLDMPRVAVHFGLDSLFNGEGSRQHLYCYSMESLESQEWRAGRARLVLGTVRVRSRITFDSEHLAFSALHLGDNNLIAAARPANAPEVPISELGSEVQKAFRRADFAQAICLIEKHFGGRIFSLKQLLKDQQRFILGRIIEETLNEVESEYQEIYNRYTPLVRCLTDLGEPVPHGFRTAAQFILNLHLRRAFQTGPPLDLNRVVSLLDEVRSQGLELDVASLREAVSRSQQKIAERLRKGIPGKPILKSTLATLDVLEGLPFQVELWHLQNAFLRQFRGILPDYPAPPLLELDLDEEWMSLFAELGRRLSFELDGKLT